MSKVMSLYPPIGKGKLGIDTPVDIIYSNIENGFWQDIIIPLRVQLSKTEDKTERSTLKEKVLPYFTPTGKFSTRNNAGFLESSEELHIDIDGEDPKTVKKKLKGDNKVYAIYESCSGTGAVVVFKIVAGKHYDAFDGAEEYLANNYDLIADRKCRPISQPRFVTFDPNIWINPQATIFKEYVKGNRPGPKSKQPSKVVFIRSEFDSIIEKINFDITGGYQTWLTIGFAIAEKFGEDGRYYFHRISSYGSYKFEKCDRQYTSCVNGKGTGITIASFYYICKEAGINIVSEVVKVISKRTAAHRLANHTKEQAINNMIKFPDTDAAPELITEIATQIYDEQIQIPETSEIEACRVWLKDKPLYWNLITGLLEDDGKEMYDSQFADLRLEIREAIPDLNRMDMADLLNSKAMPGKHPIFEFFKKHEDTKPEGAIRALAASLNSPTGAGTDYVERMLTKWLVGGIANLYGKPKFEESHLMLVLCGNEHGTGKSHFFKKFLPDEFARYVSQKDFSLLTDPAYRRDVDIAITRNWLVWDDEMGGKSKRDHRTIKALLAKSHTDVRASYARLDEKRKRIAFFGGTSNDLDVVPEQGDQRRIIPIEVKKMIRDEKGNIIQLGLDKRAKDLIDPVDYIMEAYHLYHSGYDYTILNSEIDFLNAQTKDYGEVTKLDLLLSSKFEASTNEYYTLADIGSRVKFFWPSEPWTPKSLGIALKSIGVGSKPYAIKGSRLTERRYGVREKVVSLEMLRDLGRTLSATGNTDPAPF